MLPIEGLFALIAEHPIHQDFGAPDDHSHNEIQRWRSDPDFLRSVKAMHTIQGVEQEHRFLIREKIAMMTWASEQLEAIDHAIQEASELTIVKVYV